MKSFFVRLGVLSMCGALSTARAQLVTPKTVPIHQDEQFGIVPSARAGMGGVSVALDDTLADPFANPAKATAVRFGNIFTMPFAHGISAGRGGGHTLPVGGLGSLGDWSGGIVFALQELDHGPGAAISDRTASNQYGNVVVARRFAGDVSLGASAYVAGLNAVDGVDLLYQGSDRIVQSGTLTDFRLGATKAWGERRLDVVVLKNHTNMTQDVRYTTTFYPPYVPGTPVVPVVTQRTDHNVDRTDIWGAHTQYSQPVGTEGWRVGWLATANRLSHPKIPNYQIQNIPRDPGTTYAFNAGVGAARMYAHTTFGVDVIEEPMFSNTWGTASSDTAIVGGGLLHAGERTVDNHFTFSNSKIRIGLSHDVVLHADTTQVITWQLGLGVYAINYRLHQTNHVQANDRYDDEGWTEWTPSLGLRWRTKELTLQYTYRRTCGPSDCVDLGFSGDKATVPAPVTTGGIIAAPSSPLTIQTGVSHVHQLLVMIPIR